MKLSIFNGSPRYKAGNTKILLEKFIAGFMETPGNCFELSYLAANSDAAEYKKLFRGSEAVIIAFPLYADSMPSKVKMFMESLKEFKGKKDNPQLGFIVQSGFPEGVHSSYVEKYLKKLCVTLGCFYLGTIIKGGVEGIQIMPSYMTKKLFSDFTALGRIFGRTEYLDKPIISRMKLPFRYSPLMYPLIWLMKTTGLNDWYWNSWLKRNKVFEKRFDQPYK
jgi:NAD(P)H-dependent FMN reductase